MRRENSLLKFKLVSFYKQNPVYVKLVVIFLLLGLTIFLLSSHSIDYSSSVLQTQTSLLLDPQETNLLASVDDVLETETSPTNDPQQETDFITSDEGSVSSKTTEFDAVESNSTGINTTEFDTTESNTTGFNTTELDTTEFSTTGFNTTEFNSTELYEDEAKPKCDLFRGDWIPDLAGPAYDNNTCPFMEVPQDCMTNGRPDSGYLFWKWKPRDCELPKFNAKRFLDLMRNKSWAFIGDSIARNHVQSLLCILSKAEPAKQIYHDEQFKSRTWIFPSHNFTVYVIWSPFLVKADIFEDNNGASTSETELHLDELETKWTSQYTNFDYVIIAGGKWFLKSAIYHENNTVLGCHYCPGKNLTEIGFDNAYRKALEQVFNFVKSSSHKPLVFFRTITPDHFENGEWWSGGTCTRKMPFKAGEVNVTVVDKILHDVEVQEFEKAVGEGSENRASLKLLHTTQLSLLRPDGHPGPYRQYHPFAADKNAKVQNDCLHWCLPGPIDSWNDLVMEILMNG